MQDLNISRVQRSEDRQVAREQREQDMNISREQRENDKWIAEEQRKHDKQIAVDKRVADDLNADIQRNMTRDQRMYEVNVEQERYKNENNKYLDALLLSYYNEMGELFQRTNENSLSINPVTFALARAKTLNVIEQVGPIRAAHLVMFLYSAGQLTIGEKSLDLTEAYLNNINLQSQRTLINIRLVGAHLNNASFDGRDVSHANFRGAQLNNASFRGSICIGTIFDRAHLIEADFSHANISNASFVEVDLRRSMFHKTTGKNPRFEYARMQEANCSDVKWTFDALGTSGFIESNLADSEFHRANLEYSRFLYCNLTRVDFADADLRKADMTGSIMFNATFVNTDIGHARLLAANFSYANLTTLRCAGSYPNISACRLKEALTLENAHLPNGSFGLPLTPFFTEKDHPLCSSHVLGEKFPFANDSQWKIEPPNSVLNQYRFLPDNYVKIDACVLTPIKINVTINMTRNIDLTKYAALIQASRARMVINCFVGYATSIAVTQLSNNQTKLEPDDRFAFRWFQLLKPTTTSLKLTLQFVNPMDNAYSWFHDIQLYIYTDFKAPDAYLLHSNPT